MKKSQNAIYMLKSVTNIQMESFVITTAGGKLFVIDGGFMEDADYLLEFLRELTAQAVPYIDAWLLSHAHADHISAFYEIVNNKRDSVTFDKVLCNIPSPQFLLRGGDGNSADMAEKFYEYLPLYAKEFNVVTEGDVYEFGDAKFEILYTPDPAFLRDVGNNATTIFKMTLGGKVVLFLGDCGVEAGDKMLAKYKGTDTLKADVCQMAHHGQNGATRAFYEEVMPEICFWCAPNWLWDNDAGQGFNTHFWKTVEVRGWMEELGAKQNFVLKDGTQAYTW